MLDIGRIFLYGFDEYIDYKLSSNYKLDVWILMVSFTTYSYGMS